MDFTSIRFISRTDTYPPLAHKLWPTETMKNNPSRRYQKCDQCRYRLKVKEKVNVGVKCWNLQNSNMQALIEDLQSSRTNNRIDLPEFYPDKADTDARAWCATADLCFVEKPLIGGQLVVAISKALKGAASTWLSQVAYQGMTWSEFKVLLSARFVSSETLAGTLITH